MDETDLGSWIQIHQFSRVSMLHLDPWIRWRSTPPLMEEKREKCLFQNLKVDSNSKDFVQFQYLPIYSYN